ncbi:growth/differentiation factor 9 [Cololabis saira]|uniref:growth/differentiation factor 9 n=1 Tax=Cololabis saira TaxID=129043 RepID=UPI002AD25EA4|nr:growth/differentiation factor 9 [Cololabis saira]
MEKQTLKSAVTRRFRTVLLLLLATCSPRLVGPRLAAADALHGLGDVTQPYSSIFSPLLKALSEYGGSRWKPGSLAKRMKPEHRYIRYLTDVYKKSSRAQSLDGDEVYNTIRLIKPEDECLAQSSKESFMQDLSYSLLQVRKEEQLLKSALLYRLDRNHSLPVNSVCYLNITESELVNQCQLCPGVYRTVNFTAITDGRSHGNWVEVDVTSFLQPFVKVQKKVVHLFINVSCPEVQRARTNDCRDSPELTLRPPPLILYLNDTSKFAHQRLPPDASADQWPSSASNIFKRQAAFKPDHREHGRRWKRESSKSKRDDKSLNNQLPELLPISEFPTSHCALYDFRVRFSQLSMDHWIVFPRKYNPRYCRGLCPRTLGFIYGSPVHSLVQNIIYEKLDSSVPKPSCVPSHYSPLTVLMFEKDGSYTYKDLADMVATRCTCR